MKRIFFAATLCVIFSSAALFAQGPSPFQFLRFNHSARAAALSGAFTTVQEDPNAVFFNPATISTVEGRKAGLTFTKHVLDINSGLAVYSDEIGETGNYAASIIYTNNGTFERADKFGNHLGEFGANNFAFGASYSDELDTNFFYGLTGKFLFTNIDDQSSTALALDAGLLYKMRDGRTNLGVSILNVGTQLSTFNGVKENLPLNVRIDASHRLRGMPLLVNASFHHLADETENFFQRFENIAVGGELYINKLQLRLGFDNLIYKSALVNKGKGLAGFSGGVGFNTKDIFVDYGIASYGSSIYLHRLSIAMGF